ncbi:hypothetical protein OKW45_001992 [Paraburkholderia sp. WSM4175]|uniref:hypothetical protein n=1 Tax=Paraburkholderia sp. WSM4175 TaxID=2991072 RepID=UPI003D205624
MTRAKPETDPVRERLQQLHDQHDGNLTPEIGVADARDPKSPLHALLEWDNKKAGHAYRLMQMREIIRSVTLIVHSTEMTIVAPCYVKDPDTRAGYCSVVQLATDEDRARRALISEFTAVRGRLVRARALARVLSLENEIDALLTGIAEVQQHFSAPPPMTQ